MAPIIGITPWRRFLPTFLGEETDLYTLGVEYVDCIQQAGGIPVILPPASNADAVLDRIDGLVLSGGDDVDPATYGEEATEAVYGANRAADRWEIALIQGAARRKLPMLAICRGMQIMAVAFGGRLAQDISGAAGHPDVHDMGPDEILAQRHPVFLEPSCRLAQMYGTSQRLVNTIHHQAVTDPGDLEVVGRGPGGVIEALEPRSDWPAVAVQWHPEKLDDPAELPLFGSLIAAAERYATARLEPAR